MSAEFYLSGSPVTAACYWQYEFHLTYKIVLCEHKLKLSLKVYNASNENFTYNFAFHAYLKTSHIKRCVIKGLTGCNFTDKVLLQTGQERNNITISQWTDRIYKEVPDKFYIKHLIGNSSMKLTKCDLPDVAIWNPWIEKGKLLNNFISEEYENMLCIQPGYLHSPKELSSGFENESSLIFEIKQL